MWRRCPPEVGVDSRGASARNSPRRWPHRLAVRTGASHVPNGSSILPGVTRLLPSAVNSPKGLGAFLFWGSTPARRRSRNHPEKSRLAGVMSGALRALLTRQRRQPALRSPLVSVLLRLPAAVLSGWGGHCRRRPTQPPALGTRSWGWPGRGHPGRSVPRRDGPLVDDRGARNDIVRPGQNLIGATAAAGDRPRRHQKSPRHRAVCAGTHSPRPAKSRA